GAPTTVEYHAQRVIGLLPGASVERTRDVFPIDYNGDEGIVVVVTPEALELRLPTIEWTAGSYGPAESSRLWKRRAWSRLSDSQLARLPAAAQQERRAQFQVCRHCHQSFPPERRISGDVRHGCAERHEGRV